MLFFGLIIFFIGLIFCFLGLVLYFFGIRYFVWGDAFFIESDLLSRFRFLVFKGSIFRFLSWILVLKIVVFVFYFVVDPLAIFMR